MTARTAARKTQLNLEVLENRIVPAWFLKMDGIPGESMVPGHEAEIEILSVGWGVTDPAPGTTGKATVHDISVMKKMDSASPLLFQKCAMGEHIKEAFLKLEGTSPEGQDFFYQYKFKDILITSCQQGGGGQDYPLEEFSLNYAKMSVRYEYDGRDRKVMKPHAGSRGPDLNGDGTKDPLFFDMGTIRDLNNDGMLDLVPPPSFGPEGQPHSPIHDLDGDGRPDPMPNCGEHDSFFDVFFDINFDGTAEGQMNTDQDCNGQRDPMLRGDRDHDSMVDSFFDVFVEVSIN